MVSRRNTRMTMEGAARKMAKVVVLKGQQVLLLMCTWHESVAVTCDDQPVHVNVRNALFCNGCVQTITHVHIGGGANMAEGSNDISNVGLNADKRFEEETEDICSGTTAIR